MEEEARLNQEEVDRIVAMEANEHFEKIEANMPMTNYEKSKLKT